MAQCSGQDQKPLSDFGSGRELMAMLQHKNNEEKMRILKEESQLADSTLQLMKSFRGDDAVIFNTPKGDEIKEARDIEKIFEENQVRDALQKGLKNLKIKTVSDEKSQKKHLAIDYNYFGGDDINTGIFLMDRTLLEIKKIVQNGKITDQPNLNDKSIDSVLIVAKTKIPTSFERIRTEQKEIVYDKQWKIEIAKTDEYTISVTFPKTIENRLLYIQAETIDGKLMDPGTFTAIPLTDFNEEAVHSVENISKQLRKAKSGSLENLNKILEKDLAQYKKVRQLVAYAEHSAKKNQNNTKFDLMQQVIKKGNEMQLLSENKRIIYAQFPAVPEKIVLIFGKNEKEIQLQQWIIKQS